MYKIIVNFLLLALFIGASAFTTPQVAAPAAKAETPESDASKNLLTLSATQVGPGSVFVSWTSNTSGPFLVTVRDITNNTPFVIFSTSNFNATLNNMTAGHTYRISVGDTSILSVVITVV